MRPKCTQRDRLKTLRPELAEDYMMYDVEFQSMIFFSLVHAPTRAKINSYLVRRLKDAYLAFEALTDHPYAFSSMLHGFFPLLTSCDGCNKLATNNFTLEQCKAQREKQVIDVDLGAELLTLSMLSPMVFSKRLQFVSSTPMTFCPENRKSNVFTLEARGPGSDDSDILNGDGNELLSFLKGKGAIDDVLEALTMDGLKELYHRCFGSAKGSSR